MSKTLNVIIVEDDLTHRINAELICQKLELEVKGCFSNAYDALAQIIRHKPDLILVDIELEEGTNGLALIKDVLSLYQPAILLTTSYAESKFIEQAFSMGVTEYLVKPLDINNLKVSIEMALLRQKQQSPTKEALLLKTALGFDLINYEDIDYIETDGNRYCLIHTLNKSYRDRTTLAEIIQKLPSKDFLRTHKSYAIRLGAIKSLQNNQQTICLSGGKSIPLGEKYRSVLLDMLK